MKTTAVRGSFWGASRSLPSKKPFTGVITKNKMNTFAVHYDFISPICPDSSELPVEAATNCQEIKSKTKIIHRKRRRGSDATSEPHRLAPSVSLTTGMLSKAAALSGWSHGTEMSAFLPEQSWMRPLDFLLAGVPQCNAAFQTVTLCAVYSLLLELMFLMFATHFWSPSLNTFTYGPNSELKKCLQVGGSVGSFIHPSNQS